MNEVLKESTITYSLGKLMSFVSFLTQLMFFPWFSCGSLHGSLSALKILVTLALALVQVRRACQCVLL